MPVPCTAAGRTRAHGGSPASPPARARGYVSAVGGLVNCGAAHACVFSIALHCYYCTFIDHTSSTANHAEIIRAHTYTDTGSLSRCASHMQLSMLIQAMNQQMFDTSLRKYPHDNKLIIALLIPPFHSFDHVRASSRIHANN
jgi:hypothetical protein